MDKKKRASIKDIAQDTGFSIATVSRVINGTNRYYSEKTRRIVEESVQRLNYHPNLIAKGLKEHRTFNIAYLIPQVDDFYSRIYNGMQEDANSNGYSIVILSSNYSKTQEQININHILEKQYDGVIIATGLLDKEKNNAISEVFRGIPVVFVEGIEQQPGVRRVSADVQAICQRAVEYLIAMGHEKIAYVSAPCRFETLHYRYQGYAAALTAQGLPLDPSLVFFDPNLELSRFNECYEAMQKIISKNDFTAMFVMSDWAAFTAIRVAREMKRKVPEDLSIIGFDNLPFTEFSEPTLTTISQKSGELGRNSIRLLLKTLENEIVEDVLLDAKIIMRESVGPRKK